MIERERDQQLRFVPFPQHAQREKQLWDNQIFISFHVLGGESFCWMNGGREKLPPTILKPPIGNIIKGKIHMEACHLYFAHK